MTTASSHSRHDGYAQQRPVCPFHGVSPFLRISAIRQLTRNLLVYVPEAARILHPLPRQWMVSTRRTDAKCQTLRTCPISALPGVDCAEAGLAQLRFGPSGNAYWLARASDALQSYRAATLLEHFDILRLLGERRNAERFAWRVERVPSRVFSCFSGNTLEP